MNERTAILSRMFIILGLILLIPCALGFQLIRVNFFEGDELRALWNKQAIDQIPIPAQRGNIYDANGTLLATNAVDYKLAFDPKVQVNGKIGVPQSQVNQLTGKLADLTGRSAAYYQNKINSAPPHSRYIVLDTNLSIFVKDEIKALNIKGVILEENYRRKYTFGSLASHALGFVNHKTEGRIGLEAFYNDELKGEDGVRQVRRDPFNRIFEYIGSPKKLPRNGYSLHTTIDAYLQAILEDELKAGVEKHLANYGTGIIMDPKTGAIKALANYPTYDPNYPASSEDENRRNFAISDMMEPGSTFKLVTAIAAVEQGVVESGEIFETPENGEVIIHDLILRDHVPLGNLTFQEVIQKSSNVAMAEIAMRMEPEVFYQYARNMGFGNDTNIDLIGEVEGRLAKPYEWSLVTLPWMSHGYEILATPLQIAQSYAAFANNGMMMRPYIVERIEDKNGNIIKQHDPIEIRRVAKKSTLEKLLPIFESVVTDSGTGYLAQVDGLRIAGKTGTAKKVVNGQYTNNYRGSFVGFFPVEDPQYVCFILLDEPKTSGYGGLTAAPIFKKIATRIAGLDNNIQRDMNTGQQQAPQFVQVPFLKGLSQEQAEILLSNLNIPYSISGKTGYIAQQMPEAGTELSRGQEISLTLSETYINSDSVKVKEGYAVIPDLKGMNMRQAASLLIELGLQTQIIGSGTVFAQYPKTGAWMRKGYTVTIRGKAKSLETLTQVSDR
ncbi:MAG TPA: penicillin-binding transpeptidase domain-containing protein [Gracilimonas sp.]|uniref:penicillin-binding transpeptidase domain-containing protein n=1 Tax=Gracilimonas sp. TaxID=1974203 RepID=UPI002D842FB8|nr:penicillin-binding transpeptidase domain-containing protein [Gracilimonas sp.]